MAITYEEALSTLTSMFGDASPPWTEQQLDAVLRHHEGHMENTVETVLGHGDGDPDELVERLQNPRSVGAAGGSSSGATTPIASNESSGGSGSSGNNNTRKLRGIKTELPPDFLRIPGYHDHLIDGEVSDTIDADEQLARMLQDELFAQELRNNPEFAHLAGSSGRGRSAAGGAVGGFPGSRRPGSTSAAATANAQPVMGPAVIDRLGEMGENAKKRLTLFARQFNERMHERQAQNGGGIGGVGSLIGGSGAGGNAAAAAGSSGAERRGLLDLELGDDEEDEEVSFQEMGNVGGAAGGKKTD